ncbi:MAG TPA: dihydrofolate reductase family protein [Actinomycetospora sp.]|nr:dihydrofolate reductase family protein [Actinomycetospora sp.]
MRQLVVTVITSLDGFVAGPGGDVMVMPFDEGFDVYNAERLRAADTLLLGRDTWAGFRSFWPAIADDPAPRRDEEREISRLNTAMEKVVVSDSLTIEGGSTWDDTSRVVARDAAADTVRELTAGEGGDVLVFGSLRTWNPLLVAGLVDELHVMVGPVLLGAGMPLLASDVRVPLRLLEARRLPDSSLVLHRYDARGDG